MPATDLSGLIGGRDMVQSQVVARVRVDRPSSLTTIMAPPEVSIDNIVHQVTTSNNAVALNHTIKSILPKETRDLILSGPLASGQDPLYVLDFRQNSLGLLYILYASK